MICNKRIALIVFTALICATKSSPASRLAAEFRNQNSRLVARSHGNYSDVDDHHEPSKLTPEHWNELDLDEYLRNYPNGNSLSLPMYVEQLQLGTEFECGVHKRCSVGSINADLSAKDYYILFATAQWNYYTNSLSNSIRSASDLVKHHVPHVIHDFVKIPPGGDDARTISEPDLIRIVLGGITEGGTVHKSGVGNATNPDYLAAIDPISTDLPQKLLVEAATAEKSAGDHGAPTSLSTPPASSGTTQSFSLPAAPNSSDQETHQSTEEKAHHLSDQNEELEEQKPAGGSEEDYGINSSEPGTRPLSVHQALRTSQIDGGLVYGGSSPEDGVQVNTEDNTGTLKPLQRHQRMQKRQLTGSDIPVLPIVYNSTASMEFNIDSLVKQFQVMVDDSFTHKVNAPISLDTGIYGALKGGRFLVEHVKPATMRPNAQEVINLLTISALLQTKNAMIVYRKTNCHISDDLEESDTLHFCSTDGTLAEIVLVEGNSLTREIYHARLIQDRYGFSTAFLAAQAWRCEQFTEGKPEAPKFKHDRFEVCSFDLPVCNLKEPRLARMLDEGSSIVKLCRQEVGLPI